MSTRTRNFSISKSKLNQNSKIRQHIFTARLRYPSPAHKTKHNRSDLKRTRNDDKQSRRNHKFYVVSQLLRIYVAQPLADFSDCRLNHGEIQLKCN